MPLTSAIAKGLFTLSLSLLLAGCLAPQGMQSQSCPTVPGATVVSTTIDGEGFTGIQGRVFIKEGEAPLERGYVNIYPDTISNLLGPSQFISQPTAADGSYRIALPPGTYYVVARKRMTGSATGPLAPGDFYSEHQRIVTTVLDGKISLVDLPVVSMKAPMFFKKEVVDSDSNTGIQGRLIDTAGKPVPGGFAMAYTDATMKRLPDYASTLSDAEGRFTIYLPEGGSYYLAARIHAWDMPQPGEPYGLLANPVVVKKGEFAKDVAIVLSPFSGTYEAGKSQRPF